MTNKVTNKLIATIILIGALSNGASLSVAMTASFQGIKVTGKYDYKTYREGKGGFVNALEITKAPDGKFHVSFGGTYLYMAGKDETFHEGSGEGVGQLQGNILSVTLNDGAGGTCPLTITFSANTATVKPLSRCGLNVNPAGLYRKETKPKRSLQDTSVAEPPAASESMSKGFEVCPDPKAPCSSKVRSFAPYELPFRLPVSVRPNREYKSAPFYGIIIKTYESEDCDADDHTASIERERIQIQKTYPTRKVFASYSCPNMDALTYDFPGLRDPSGERELISTFIGVYAGQTSAEAEEFLVYVRTIFPQAMLKRMTISYSRIDQ